MKLGDLMLLLPLSYTDRRIEVLQKKYVVVAFVAVAPGSLVDHYAHRRASSVHDVSIRMER
jgi:hypothetical protein